MIALSAEHFSQPTSVVPYGHMGGYPRQQSTEVAWKRSCSTAVGLHRENKLAAVSQTYIFRP